jgi:hypothetical protein
MENVTKRQLLVAGTSGVILDWLVWCIEKKFDPKNTDVREFTCVCAYWNYSTDRDLGFEIIERAGISIDRSGPAWYAHKDLAEAHGSTMLEAGLRCYVLSVFGDIVEIDEFMWNKSTNR